MSAQPKPASRGVMFYAHLLTLLSREPRTIRSLAAAHGARFTPNTRSAVRALHAERVVHIAGWVPASRGGKASAVFAIGGAADAPMPAGGRVLKRPKRIRCEMLAFIAAVRCLESGPVTCREVSEQSGMHIHLALRLVKYLHQSRIVHVGAWEIEHHTPTRAWVFGPGKDKPKPAPQPQRVVEIRYYEKAKARREQLRALHSLAANTPHFNQARRA